MSDKGGVCDRDIALKDEENLYNESLSLQLSNILASHLIGDTDSIKSSSSGLPYDIEQDIPEINILPSLEDILAQEDPIFDLDIDIREDITHLGTSSLSHVDEDDIMSQFSGSISVKSFSSTMSPKKITSKPKPKSKVHGSVVSSTNISLLDIISSNDRPNVICIRETIVAIGYFSGKINIMLLNGEKKGTLNTQKVNDGSISAIDVFSPAAILVSGHAEGTIHIWDLVSNSHLQTLNNSVHVPGTMITQLVLLDKARLLCVSSQGSVFDIRLTKTLSIRGAESSCLFSGSHGEVLNIKRLNINDKLQPLYALSLVALCTFKQIMIISLKPYPDVKYSVRLWGKAPSLPIITWYYHPTDCPKPTLLIARDSRVIIYSLNLNKRGQVFLRKIKSCSLPFKIISVQWLNVNTMAVLDTTEKLHIVDVPTFARLQIIAKVCEIEFCYNTSDFRSLSTGGQVSEAMYHAAARACYSTSQCSPGSTWFIGRSSVLKVKINPWKQRIQLLASERHYGDAIDLALTFYRGKGKGVSSLVLNNIESLKAASKKLALSLFEEYLEMVQEDLTQLGVALTKCIDACIELEEEAHLYSNVYEKLSKIPQVKVKFHEALEPFILSNKISSLNPILMADMLEYFKQTSKLNSFEKSILHLNPANLDIHNSLILCMKHDMFEAILFIYNRCLLDFTTPLNKLFVILKDQLLNKTKDHKPVGYILLMYMSDCMIGNFTSPDKDFQLQIQNQVFNHVFCRHTPEGAEDESEYPRVKLMLLLDTREFLNVMALTFEHHQCLPIHQIVIDILLMVMVDSEGQSYTPLQIGHLFTFLARQFAKISDSFQLDQKYLEQALECLTTKDTYCHEEREQALLELILLTGTSCFNEDRLLELSESAEFYQVCEVIYEKRHEYDKVLYCYWSDSSRTDKVFQYIQHIMEGKEYSEEDKDKIRETCVSNIGKLVEINSEDTANLILKDFSTELNTVVNMLEDQPKTLYSFLQCVFDISKVDENENNSISLDVHETYIQLMCKFNPEFVCSYLKVATNYRLDATLEICLIANLKDAAAFLYEKRGDLDNAFQLYYDAIECRIKDNALLFVRETLLKIIQFCQRNSHKVSDKIKESYWFSLIDILLQYGNNNESDQYVFDQIIELQESLIDSMLGFVSPSKVLDKLLRDSRNLFKTFGDIKRLVVNMLDSVTYEEILLKSTINIVHNDLFNNMKRDKRAFNRGFSVKSNTCVVCSQIICINDTDLLIFSCSHTVHTECVENQTLKYCVKCECQQDQKQSKRMEYLRNPSFTAPYQQTHFEKWRNTMHSMRENCDRVDRLELLHELVEYEHDDIDIDAFFNTGINENIDISQCFDGFEQPSAITPKKSRTPEPIYKKSYEQSCEQNYQNGRMLDLQPGQNKQSPRHSPKHSSNPVTNPFGSNSVSENNDTNPFGDDTDTTLDMNPFGNNSGDDLNPFGVNDDDNPNNPF